MTDITAKLTWSTDFEDMPDMDEHNHLILLYCPELRSKVAAIHWVTWPGVPDSGFWYFISNDLSNEYPNPLELAEAWTIINLPEREQ